MEWEKRVNKGPVRKLLPNLEVAMASEGKKVRGQMGDTSQKSSGQTVLTG